MQYVVNMHQHQSNACAGDHRGPSLAFIEANTDPDSKKFTDENRAYNDLENY